MRVCPRPDERIHVDLVAADLADPVANHCVETTTLSGTAETA
ncbi:MAG: hypothetical protein OXD50_14860 [Chloroflexi bacterium]|nr:hypothetical protein [Chloroflexota bacterium]